MSITTTAFNHPNKPELRLKSKGINRERKALLGKILSWQPLRDLRNISTLTKKETTSSSNTRWSLRQKCAEIGNYLVNASSLTLAASHMENTNFIKKHTYLLIIKQSFVISSIQLLIVLMEIDANFCIHSTTFSILSH